MNILIIEDHPLFAQSLSQHCLGKGYTVSWAKSYIEFEEKIVQNRYDIALVDIALEGMDDGLDISEKLKADYPKTKIIIISSFDQDHLVSKAIRLKVDGYLLKSADLPEIELAIEKVTKNETYFSQPLKERLDKKVHFLERNKINLPAIRKRKLTSREIDVIKCIVENEHQDESLALRLGLSIHTIRDYKKSIYQKLDVHDVAGIVKFYYRYLYQDKGPTK